MISSNTTTWATSKRIKQLIATMIAMCTKVALMAWGGLPSHSAPYVYVANAAHIICAYSAPRIHDCARTASSLYIRTNNHTDKSKEAGQV